MINYYSRAFHSTNTLCPKCKVEMVEGKAIQYGSKEFDKNVCVGFGRPMVNHKTLNLIECLKCPKCGHSDDLD